MLFSNFAQTLAASLLIAAVSTTANQLVKRDSCLTYKGSFFQNTLGSVSLSTPELLAPNSHWVALNSIAYTADWSMRSQLLTLNATAATNTFNVFVVKTALNSYRYTLNKGDMCQVTVPKAPLDTVKTISVELLSQY